MLRKTKVKAKGDFVEGSVPLMQARAEPVQAVRESTLTMLQQRLGVPEPTALRPFKSVQLQPSQTMRPQDMKSHEENKLGIRHTGNADLVHGDVASGKLLPGKRRGSHQRGSSQKNLHET